MTTVYVNKRLGIAITDSRATSEISRYLFGFFPLTSLPDYQVVSQKAMYINDRLFVASGSVGVINQVAQYFANGLKPEFTNKKRSCECLLISDEYAIRIIVEKGKWHKDVIFFNKSWVYIMGSGSNVLYEKLKDYTNLTHDDVFNAFRTVKDHDNFTDDNINLYRI